MIDGAKRPKQLIPIPDQSDRSLLRLAVLQHCLRLRAYSRIDLETELEGRYAFKPQRRAGQRVDQTQGAGMQ